MNWLILAAACLCGEAPERANDFFWENDCVGFRAYGPGDVHKWSGIDVFNKSCAENIVVHWLRHSRTNAAYKGWHKNHGFGMDDYAVGPGRGVGGVALRKNGQWLPDYGNWYRYRVLTNGDERCSFELDYRLPIGGTMTLGISLPRGSSFFTETVSFSSDTPLEGVEVGVGLDLNAQRLHAGDVFVDEPKGIVSLFENPHLGKDGKPVPGEEGATMTALMAVRHVAAMVDEPNGAKMLMTKPLASSDANGKPVLEVLAGADWTLAGRHTTAAVWHETVRAAAAKAAAPADDGLVRVTIETSLGDIELGLDAQKAPASVANFVAYAKAGHYADTIFHRVINGFMIQGGGFTADMRQKETRPPIRNEAANGLKNARGTIAMARTMVVDSATCQFFINLVDNTFLDHRSPDPRGFGYAVFGRVTKGMDVVDRIAKVATGDRWPHQNVPLEPVTIKRVLVKE